MRRFRQSGQFTRFRSGDESGAAVVEMAFVTTLIFIPLIWGIFTFGYAFAIRENMTHGTQEALRNALLQSAPGSGVSAHDVACNAMQQTRDRMKTIVGSTYNQPPGTIAAVPSDCGVSTTSDGALDIWTNYTVVSGIGQFPACKDNSNADIPGSQCITVSVRYYYSRHPVVAAAPGIYEIIPGTFTITATQRVQ